MAHRDQHVRTASATYAQELTTALHGLLAQVDWQRITLRQDCGWAPAGLVMAALLWACSAQQTLQGRFAQALQVVGGLGRRWAPQKTSYQAFLKLLVRWTAELRASVRLAFQLLMEREFPAAFRTAGFVVFVGDGSKAQLARTRSNEARYAPAKTRRPGKRRRRAAQRRARSRAARARQARQKKADSPQLALTLLYHVALRLPWDWRLGPSDASERQQLRDMVPHLPAAALVVADCGFVGYDFWADLLASGRHFVIRVGANVRLLKQLGCARERQGTVYLWPAKAAKRRQPPLVLRLVVVHDGRQAWHLVTSVLDRQRLSDAQVAACYRRRWRIELFFRHFKQTFGRAKLRSHKAAHVACEAEWALLGLWAMLLHALRQVPAAQAQEEQLSVAKVLRAWAQAIHEHRCRPLAGAGLLELLAHAMVDRSRRRHKTSRNYPRKKYESPAGAPHLMPATHCQRQRAQELMRAAA